MSLTGCEDEKALNDVVNQCVGEEITYGSTNQLEQVAITEMSALLELGRCEEARHLWRRLPPSPPPSPLLEQLWNITRAMMNHDSVTAFSLLRSDIMCSSSEEAKTSEHRFQKIEDAYRSRMERVLSKSYRKLSVGKGTKLLGMPDDKPEELINYLQAKGWSVSLGGSNNTTTFLLPASKTGKNAAEGGNKAILEEKLKTFTDIVSFMEKTRFNV